MNDDRQRYAIHAAVFAALANPTRHELMHHLCEEPRTGERAGRAARRQPAQCVATPRGASARGAGQALARRWSRALGSRRPAARRGLHTHRRDPRSRACHRGACPRDREHVKNVSGRTFMIEVNVQACPQNHPCPAVTAAPRAPSSRTMSTRRRASTPNCARTVARACRHAACSRGSATKWGCTDGSDRPGLPRLRPQL